MTIEEFEERKLLIKQSYDLEVKCNDCSMGICKYCSIHKKLLKLDEKINKLSK